MNGYQITIRAARINAGLSIEQAAKALKMTTESLSRYEQDSGKMHPCQVVAMMKLYNIPNIDMLYFGKERDCADRKHQLDGQKERMALSPRQKPAAESFDESSIVERLSEQLQDYFNLSTKDSIYIIDLLKGLFEDLKAAEEKGEATNGKIVV